MDGWTNGRLVVGGCVGRLLYGQLALIYTLQSHILLCLNVRNERSCEVQRVDA